MTLQSPDKVLFEGNEYYLTGMDGINLPTPVFFGLSLAGWSTNCRRGYKATYEITDGRLAATFNPSSETQRNLSCQFTGGMIMGKNHVQGLFGLIRDFGYNKPAAFQTVLELIFVAGTLKHVYDRSEFAAEIRARFDKYRTTAPNSREVSSYFGSLEHEFAVACGYPYKDLGLVLENLNQNTPWP